jgi:uncharacterized repeat protein (TIGR01451 family)
LRLKSLLIKTALLCCAILCLGNVTAQGWTITRTSSPVFYTDFGANIRGMYVSYQILNNSATSYPDVWVAVDTFTGASVSLAPGEDGVVQLGPMAANEVKTAYFYLQASANTATPQSHTVRVYPTRPPTGQLASSNFSMTVEDTIQANANKITTTVAGPNPPGLGGIVTVTVTGHTGTIGSQNLLSFTPASELDWIANNYQLMTTTVVLSGSANAGTYNDQLFISGLATSSDTNYTVNYSFRATGVGVAPQVITPMVFIASGTQIKHTQGDPSTISPATNSLTLSKLASATTVYLGATVTYTLRLSNVGGAYDATVEDFVDTLPSSPGTPAYVTNTSTYNGVAISNPSVSGSTLTWVGSFTVPAGQTRDLTFQVTFPNTSGTYTNNARAHVGGFQIDTTLNTSDNAPANVNVTVRTPPDIKLDKSYTANTAIIQSGTEITYTITFTNQGETAATNFTLFDMIPASTDFKLGSLTYTPVTGGVAAPTISYSNAARSVAIPPQPPSPWVSYTPLGSPGTYDPQVTYIRWAFATNIPANASSTITFIVRIQ